MTDIPSGAPAPAAPDWQNVIALGIAALTAAAGLLTVRLGVAADTAKSFCDPIILACAIVYQTGRR